MFRGRKIFVASLTKLTLHQTEGRKTVPIDWGAL